MLLVRTKAQSDQELNRDSIVGWQYILNPSNTKAVYKPIKSQYNSSAYYTAWQQQASDLLISWIQQSYLPRGLVMRTIAKEDDRWYVDNNGPLHSYGVNFLGYETHFSKGKIDLRCCEQGQRLVAGFNDFPGVYVKGFNPEGMYFFAEQAQFTTGDDEAQLAKEGVDKKIQQNLYNYRTYLDHYHDNGKQVFKTGIVVCKNNEWPFKEVLVKDAVAYINKQLKDYPAILQKNPYSVKEIQDALDRLTPYYNEATKLKANTNYNNSLNDGNGHYLLNPSDIINGKTISKSFPEFSILVSTTKQTIDLTKTDNPLWVYFNITPSMVYVEESLSKFDTKLGTGVSHMVYSLLNNINYDYIAKWLAQPEARKTMVYTPAKQSMKSAGNTVVTPVNLSAKAIAKSKEANTILYEDFQGYPDGKLLAKKWHTAGNGYEIANLSTINGFTPGKWITIPEKFTLYPDIDIPFPPNYTVSYDVYFDQGISNKRSMLYFRIDAYDPKDKYPQPMNINSAVDKGTDFGIAISGETITECKFRNAEIKEMYEKGKVPAFKEKDVAHVSVAVNGAAISIAVNGKELIRNDKALPAGKAFKRVGWYCGVPGIYLSNIEIRKQ